MNELHAKKQHNTPNALTFLFGFARFSGCIIVDLKLTTRWHRVLEHLVELAEVHHHGELVRLHHNRHLFPGHDGRNPKLFFGHVKTQLVVLLHVFLIQGIKVTVVIRQRHMRQLHIP